MAHPFRKKHVCLLKMDDGSCGGSPWEKIFGERLENPETQ